MCERGKKFFAEVLRYMRENAVYLEDTFSGYFQKKEYSVDSSQINSIKQQINEKPMNSREPIIPAANKPETPVVITRLYESFLSGFQLPVIPHFIRNMIRHVESGK